MKKKIIITENQLSSLIKQTTFKSDEDFLRNMIGSKTSGDQNDPIKISSNITIPSGGSISFKDAADLVVNNIEGGYYHPDMKTRKPPIRNIERMGKSGETMYGLDRKWGPKLPKFWEKIDSLGARNTWGYNETLKDKPDLSNQLKSILYPEMESIFSRLVNSYLSTESQEIIKKYAPLFFHFVYATWNGSGWFQKWAKSFNEEVKKGVTDLNSLEDFVIRQRANSGNSILASTSGKVGQIMDRLA